MEKLLAWFMKSKSKRKVDHVIGDNSAAVSSKGPAVPPWRLIVTVELLEMEAREVASNTEFWKFV
jgi:hypothetical protein